MGNTRWRELVSETPEWSRSREEDATTKPKLNAEATPDRASTADGETGTAGVKVDDEGPASIEELEDIEDIDDLVDLDTEDTLDDDDTLDDEDTLDDDELLADEVEASLDVILAERLRGEDTEADEEFEDDEDDTPNQLATVIPVRRPDEFLCQSCFLLKPPGQLADADHQLCRDCA